MSTVMNGGLCHATGKRLIKAETLEHMFTPQLGPQHLPFPPLETARREFVNSYPNIDPGDAHKNFGFGMVLVGDPEGTILATGERGMACGTGWWIGATGVIHWIDRATGVSG